MSSSEDYLDSLLASALQKNENPDSDGSGMSSLDLGDNPNRMMSEEEIAALFQNRNPEQETKDAAPADLSRFGRQEEIRESVSDALLNHKEEGVSYSSVNVDESVSEALSNQKENTTVYSSVNVEESVSEALTKPKETNHDTEKLFNSDKEDKHLKSREKPESVDHNEYTKEDIDNRADELLSLLQDETGYDEKYDDTEDIEDDIEARLKAAEQEGINDAAKAGLMGLSLSEEAMDFTEFVDSKGIHSDEISNVSELLKKSDDGRLIDESSLPKQNFSEQLDLAENPLAAAEETEQENNRDLPEPEKKKKRRKEKKSGKKNASDIENSQENEAGDAGKPKDKNNRKNKKKNKKGLFWFLSKDNEETASEIPLPSGETAFHDSPAPDIPGTGMQRNGAMPEGIPNGGMQMNIASPEGIPNGGMQMNIASPEGISNDGMQRNTTSPEGISANDLLVSDNIGGSSEEIIVPLEPVSFGEEFPEADNNDNKEKKKKEKKDNIFTKLFQLLTEEVEEDEAHVPEQDVTKLSQENLDILSSLDAAEDNKKGKKKKEKKKKEKKGKEKKAKPKPKKKKKTAQAEKEDTKQIPKKHIMKTAAMAVSMLAILLLLCLFLPEKLVVGEARDAYYQEDYKTVFLSLYGKELNESDKLIYDRSKLIVLLERKYESYVNFKALGMKLEALNSLLEGLQRYDDIIVRGEQLNIKETLDETRRKITDALLSDYALTENEALEILQYSDLDYSNRLSSIVDGSAFIKAEDAIRSSYGLSDQNEMNGEDTVSMQLPDLLPEELEYQQSLMQGAQADSAVLQNENSDIRNENADSQNGMSSEENESMEASVADANENGSSGSPSVGGAINQNGQSLQLQIESEQF